MVMLTLLYLHFSAFRFNGQHYCSNCGNHTDHCVDGDCQVQRNIEQNLRQKKNMSFIEREEEKLCRKSPGIK